MNRRMQILIVALPVATVILFVLLMALLSPGNDLTPSKIGSGRITGLVTDYKDRPLPYTAVELVGTNLGVLTDTLGHFFIESIPVGTYELLVDVSWNSVERKQAVTVEADSLIQLEISLPFEDDIWPDSLDSLTGDKRDEAIRQLRDSGFDRGLAEAEWEIANRRATIYIMGKNSGNDTFDDETGLPTTAIAGCIVDPYIEGRAKGHNDRIMREIEQNGLFNYSWKLFEDELADAKVYFDKRAVTEIPIPLSADDQPIFSADSTASIRIRKVSFRPGHGPINCVIVSGPRGERISRQSHFGDWPDSMVVLWGPHSSDLAYLRWKHPTADNSARNLTAYSVLDLRTASVLGADLY